MMEFSLLAARLSFSFDKHTWLSWQINSAAATASTPYGLSCVSARNLQEGIVQFRRNSGFYLYYILAVQNVKFSPYHCGSYKILQKRISRAFH